MLHYGPKLRVMQINFGQNSKKYTMLHKRSYRKSTEKHIWSIAQRIVQEYEDETGIQHSLKQKEHNVVLESVAQAYIFKNYVEQVVIDNV